VSPTARPTVDTAAAIVVAATAAIGNAFAAPAAAEVSSAQPANLIITISDAAIEIQAAFDSASTLSPSVSMSLKVPRNSLTSVKTSFEFAGVAPPSICSGSMGQHGA
jgi:hypothetical protein